MCIIYLIGCHLLFFFYLFIFDFSIFIVFVLKGTTACREIVVLLALDQRRSDFWQSIASLVLPSEVLPDSWSLACIQAPRRRLNTLEYARISRMLASHVLLWLLEIVVWHIRLYS